MSHEEIKDKVLDWIAQEDIEILQDTKSEKTNFILTIKSRGNTILDFPVNVVSTNLQEGLILGFTAKFLNDDHKSFLALKIDHREKMVKEIGGGAGLASLDFNFQSNDNGTQFDVSETIFPDGITKDRFFTVLDRFIGFFRFLIHTLEKYEIAPPKVDNLGI